MGRAFFLQSADGGVAGSGGSGSGGAADDEAADDEAGGLGGDESGTVEGGGGDAGVTLSVASPEELGSGLGTVVVLPHSGHSISVPAISGGASSGWLQ